MTFRAPTQGHLCAITVGTLAFIVLQPILGLAHELLVTLFAALLRWVSESPLWPPLIERLPLDPVYTMALIHFAGEINPRGVAVAEPAGTVLHAIMPALFAPPDLVPDLWASAVIDPGSTILARDLAGFGADLLVLMLGLILFLFGLRHRLWLAVCGALQQGHVVIYKFLETRVSLQDLEAAGLPFAVSSLLSSPNDRAPWFTTELARLPDASLSLAGGLLLAGLAYAVAAAFLFAALLARRLAHGRRPVALRSFIPQLGPQPSAAAAVFSLCVLGIAVSPLGALAEVETQVIDTDPVQPGYVRPRSVVANAPSPAGPAAVNFIGGDYRYALLVNGVPHVVRGMGYNVEYASLDHLQRAELYDRDFRYMRDIGVNVIFGWFQDQFDSLTLSKAQEYGLGVAMPFELNQDHNYDDPAVRARLTEDVLRYVTLHKNDPAVWFWTPGNEVIHRLLFPSWVRHQADELNESRADSFARFYVDLVDRIHAIDPRHPVIYRDAEDHYLPRIQNALLASGKHRPWFAYGTNVYSRRLGEILEDWPNQGLDSPLVVSEFAPGGTGAVERPHALRSMWETIRSYPSSVIGGAIYTWSTNGPEELDRVFGLVDESGLPRGEALATVAEFYRDDRENK